MPRKATEGASEESRDAREYQGSYSPLSILGGPCAAPRTDLVTRQLDAIRHGVVVAARCLAGLTPREIPEIRVLEFSLRALIEVRCRLIEAGSDRADPPGVDALLADQKRPPGPTLCKLTGRLEVPDQLGPCGIQVRRRREHISSLAFNGDHQPIGRDQAVDARLALKRPPPGLPWPVLLQQPACLRLRALASWGRVVDQPPPPLGGFETEGRAVRPTELVRVLDAPPEEGDWRSDLVLEACTRRFAARVWFQEAPSSAPGSSTSAWSAAQPPGAAARSFGSQAAPVWSIAKACLKNG